MFISLALCTHGVMVCFVANHYTAKVFCVLGFSIGGLEQYSFYWIARNKPGNDVGFS